MKILIVIPGLGKAGGIRASLLGLLSYFEKRSDRVSLLVLENDTIIREGVFSNISVLKGPRIIEYLIKDFRLAFRDASIVMKSYVFLIKVLKMLVGSRKALLHFMSGYKLEGRFDVAISYVNDKYGKSFSGGANDFVRKCVKARVKMAWIHHNPAMIGANGDIFGKVYGGYDYIVNVSEAMKKVFDGIFVSDKAKSVVVGNFVNYEKVMEMSLKNNPVRSDAFVIVTVARIDNQSKRLDRVVECCSMLLDGGVRDFRWYIVGSGKDEAWLKKLAASRKVDGNLVFAGNQDNPYTYMKNADIVCCTSDYETFGIVALEALVLGTPVITTDYPAAREVLQGYENCVIADRDVNSLYKEILHLYSHREKLRQMKNAKPASSDVNLRTKAQIEELLSAIEEKLR